MKKKWILVDIGCIECGEESNVVGFFDTQEQAHEFWEKKYKRKEWIGEHRRLIQEVGDDKWELFF